jgi:hypothetical protein
VEHDGDAGDDHAPVTETPMLAREDDVPPLRGRFTSTGHRLHWWVEMAAIVVFYVVYSTIRNANEGSPSSAYHHATQVIDLEQTLGMYHEAGLQHWVDRHAHWLILFCNYFYGSLHFIVTVAVLVLLYRRFSDDYPLWRNALAVCTGLALIGFITYPLMPPRLLDVHVATAGLTHAPYGFVDTLSKDPAFWSFNSGGVNKISNQFAAMPSLHIGWSTWCAWAGAPHVRRWWVKVLLHAYPWVTLTAIVLTANHYFLDAAGGMVVFLAGYMLSRRFTRPGPVLTDPDKHPDPDTDPDAAEGEGLTPSPSGSARFNE